MLSPELTELKILSLGGCGFIGSYLARKFLDDGHQLTCVDDFSKYGYIEHDFYEHEKFRLLKKDVRELEPPKTRATAQSCVAALIGGIRYSTESPTGSRDNTNILTHAIDCMAAALGNLLLLLVFDGL
jgi:nucleoside-diphosphate-sugar epimerase